MLLNGKGIYSSLYRDSEGQTLNENTEPSDKDVTKQSLIPCINGYEDAIEYKVGVHIIKDMISSPVKTKSNEKCSGRFLHDLSRHAICNIKKAVVVAEEWLQDKEITPLGTNWDDLYNHLIVNHDKINPKV